jgi:hypothetical protein
VTRYLRHLEACAACRDALLFQHCQACHRLFLHCAGCELAYPDPRTPRDLGRKLPPGEHPACPRCEGTQVRPATRSDLQNRDMLGLAATGEP